MFRNLVSSSTTGIWTHFGMTIGEPLNHSFIQMPVTVGHKKKCIPIRRKIARPGLIRVGFLCLASPRPSSGDTTQSPREGNPSTSESFESFSDLRSTRRVEKDRDETGARVLSTFDFLDLKRELEKEENAMAGSEEEDMKPKNSEDAPSISEKEGFVVGSSRVKGGRQVMRRSSLLAKQVISMESARYLGFVSQMWVDTKLWVVALVEVRTNFLSGDIEKFLLEDVYQVGDVLLVSDEPLVEKEFKMTDLDTLVGYNVVKSGRRSIGKIRDYTFNINTGAVETLRFDSFGFSIIPSSLVSTYGLSVEDVLDVESDKVFVYEEALSRVQKLTKGIWDSGNFSKSNEQLRSRDFRRKRAYSDRSSSSSSSRRRQSFWRPKLPDEVRDDDDDGWDSPIY